MDVHKILLDNEKLGMVNLLRFTDDYDKPIPTSDMN